MAKILPIIINPNPILRQKSQPVKIADLSDPALSRLVKDMIKTMTASDGAGLAAPQVSQSMRLIIIRDTENNQPALIMINPQITKKSWARAIDQEGCLSVLNAQGEVFYEPVSRPKKINCLYLDLKGQTHKLTANDLLARVIQHEIDHLDGILFIDRVVKNNN